MLLAGGLTPQRADEFIAAGEHHLGCLPAVAGRVAVMTCPTAYVSAVR